MKVLFVAPELPPYSKVGGLGDVSAALSKALLALGVDTRVFTPLYGGIQPGPAWRPHPSPFPVRMPGKTCHGRLWETEHPESAVPVAFLEYNDYFEREGVYGPPDNSHAFGDNGQRFAFFSRAAIDYCDHVGWFPDVIHCHDWTTGLLPSFINNQTGSSNWTPSTVLTLHNLEHQGVFGPEVAEFAGLPSSGIEINFLREGLAQATALTTVSPTYADEIQSSPGGWGLESLLKSCSHDLYGILNGIDMEAWDPARDSALSHPFSHEDPGGKGLVKSALQKEMGLRVDSQSPLFGVVSRLYAQKGLDLLAACLPPLLAAHNDAQLVILGSGDTAQEDAFQSLARNHTEQVAVATRFDEGLARRIYGGSDFFVMPSRFEPCGLSQLYAMRYGTVPVVRRTGGLTDTVRSADSADGTGILFQQATPKALGEALLRALQLYGDPAAMQAIRQNAFGEDFSWDSPARAYLDLYQKVSGTTG